MKGFRGDFFHLVLTKKGGSCTSSYVMRKITLIGTVSALALTGMSFAQDAPPAAPSDAPAITLTPGAATKEASPEAKAAVAKMVELTKKTAEIFSSIKDKATAEAAFAKMKAMKEESAGIEEVMAKIPQQDMAAALMPHLQELMMASMTVNASIQKLIQADYYGCEELKKSMEEAMKQAPGAMPGPGGEETPDASTPATLEL